MSAASLLTQNGGTAMKNMIEIVIAALVAVLLTACGGGDGSSSSEGGKSTTACDALTPEQGALPQCLAPGPGPSGG
jgi:hypothetical protein